jgi:hypothetical protein
VGSALGAALRYGTIMGIAGIYMIVKGFWWMIIVINTVLLRDMEVEDYLSPPLVLNL